MSKIKREWVKIQGKTDMSCDCTVKGGLWNCARRAAFRHGNRRYCRQHAQIAAGFDVIESLSTGR